MTQCNTLRTDSSKSANIFLHSCTCVFVCFRSVEKHVGPSLVCISNISVRIVILYLVVERFHKLSTALASSPKQDIARVLRRNRVFTAIVATMGVVEVVQVAILTRVRCCFLVFYLRVLDHTAFVLKQFTSSYYDHNLPVPKSLLLLGLGGALYCKARLAIYVTFDAQ